MKTPPQLATLPGRMAAVALFTAMLAATNAVAWPAVGAVLALLSAVPTKRRAVLAVAGAVVALVVPPLELPVLDVLAEERGGGASIGSWPFVVAAAVGAALGFVEFVRRRPASFAARRPLVVLLSVLTGILALSGSGLVTGEAGILLAALGMTMSSYVWFVAYAAADARQGADLPWWSSVGVWRPFWGFSNVPMGKGLGYLARVEAGTEDALAECQASGLRLMAWGMAATFAMDALGRAVYSPAGIASLGVVGWWPAEGLPRVGDLLGLAAAGEPLPHLAVRWASVFGEFALGVLHMMAWGHPVVATCRMAGFAAAANTDRPLLSTSVAEFFNRFYFYFKELLAAFFFYPAFVRFFRRSPRLRLVFATFASAGFGNFLFHFYRDCPAILRFGFVEALVLYQVYALYAVVLAAAIAVSQLRLQAARGRKPTGPRRVAATAGVLFFYAVLNVLDVATVHPLGAYLAFYRGLIVP